jgi:peptide/nickel transport system substrate-binding protein
MATLRIPALLLFFLAILPGCQKKDVDAPLQFAQAEKLYSLDPDRAADAQSRAILSNIYEALAEFDRELKIRPALATSWNASDELTWTFELRKDVKFHDGHTLSAADVKSSFERVGGSGIHDAVIGISGIDVIDAYHVRFHLSHPSPLLLNRLTQILIIPAKQGSSPIERPVGTGPYCFVRWTKNQLELEAFDQHWRGGPSIKYVRFTDLTADDAKKEFARKGLDLYRLLPAGTLSQTQHGVRLVGRSGLAMMYLWFNCAPEISNRKNPFSDMRVRQAISMTLDRDRIVQKLGGQDTPADQLIPDGVFGFVPTWGKLAHDPAYARMLLREAGYPDGFQTTLAHPPGESYDRLGAAVAEMLAPIGIRVQPKEFGFVEFLEARRNQEFPFYALTWTFDDGDAWTFLMASLHSKTGPQDFRSTNPGYSNPLVDRLIEESQQASSIYDISSRYEAIFKIAISELPIIPLYRRYDLYAVSDRLRFNPRLDGKLLPAEMELSK